MPWTLWHSVRVSQEEQTRAKDEGRARRLVLLPVLAGLLVLAAIVLSVKDAGRFWTVVAQSGSAVVGAYLGSELQKGQALNDLAKTAETTRARARTAIRHLFDHSESLRGMVTSVQEYRDVAVAHNQLPPLRVGEWMARLEDDLRREINTCETAVDNWEDLSPGVTEVELTKYRVRSSRLATHEGE